MRNDSICPTTLHPRSSKHRYLAMQPGGRSMIGCGKMAPRCRQCHSVKVFFEVTNGIAIRTEFDDTGAFTPPSFPRLPRPSDPAAVVARRAACPHQFAPDRASERQSSSRPAPTVPDAQSWPFPAGSACAQSALGQPRLDRVAEDPSTIGFKRTTRSCTMPRSGLDCDFTDGMHPMSGKTKVGSFRKLWVELKGKLKGIF